MTGVQATLAHPRPVLRRGNRGKLARPRAVAAGLAGTARSTLVGLAERARRPALYLGGSALVCHGLWQIWEPLGSIGAGAALVVVEILTGPEVEG